MSLQSAIEAELPFLRAEAESLMLDAGKALRPTGSTYDPVEQANVDTFADLFESPCKIKPPRTVVREDQVGGRTAVTVPGELHLPADPQHAGLTEGDLWEIVMVDPLSLTVVGRQYRIKGEVDGTLVTACRYSVERVIS